MEKAQAILSSALETVNTAPSYTKIKYMKFGEDIVYYVGNMELLSATSIAVIQDMQVSPAAQSLAKLCLEQIRERKATLIVNDDARLAYEMVREGGKAIMLLPQGIKRANLKPLMQAIRDGRVLVLSMSVSDVADQDSHEVTRRLLSALCTCAFVVECQGGNWHIKNEYWTNRVLQECQTLREYGKTIFIAPWHRGQPVQHLLIREEFGAVGLPESNDPANVFSFIPEELEDIE